MGVPIRVKSEGEAFLLRVQLIPSDAANALLTEEVRCGDIFDAVRELEGMTGRRFRDRLHMAAAANLLRLNPITGDPIE